MFFACMPNIWQQVLESNQNCSSPALVVTASMLENTDSTCSDNYKTKQPLTTNTSPDPISDPIGAFLNSFGLLYEDAESEQTLNKQIKTPDRTEQTQSQIKNETETQTTATQDMTTRDLVAPGVRTADEHHTQVGAETVESLQATIGEPRIQYFPSDLYEAQFDPTSIDADRIVEQIRYQESKCSLYDFDAGPPCTIEEH
jgi:hypothetical protein